MNALPKIAEWSKELPDWLSDLARRAVEKGALEGADLEDAEGMLLSAAGIPDAAERRAVRLTEALIPVPIDEAHPVVLSGIREPANVNALDGQTSLTFGETGLTVIWGVNGAGKSGFSRILKRACRSRDQEAILPNVFTTETPGPAQAKLEWKSTGGGNSHLWVDGQSKHDDLSRVVIFDGRCARLFIDDDQEVAIAVYGVDVLREMAKACEELKRRIERRQNSCRIDPGTFDSLRGETSVGRVIQALSAKSNKDEIVGLAKLTEAEMAELKSLTEQLSDDPAKKAAALRRKAARYKQLIDELTAARTILGDTRIDEFRAAMAAYVVADQASKLASEQLREDGQVLAGTGNDPWRELMNSALAYAQEAYPNQDFPAPGPETRCVLCQQELSDEARSRLAHFVTFLRGDAQKKRDACRAVTVAFYEKAKTLDLAPLPSDPTILDELSEQDASLREPYVQHVNALCARRVALLEQAKRRKIEEPGPVPAGPDEGIQRLRLTLEEQAVALDRAARGDNRKQLVARHAELSARSKLKDFLPLVNRAIDSLQLTACLANALKQTSTHAITRKSSELTEEAIASGLNESLDQELKAIGISGLKLGIDLHGQKGQGRQQLRLNMARPNVRAKVSQILSEGEQRAISIACFLAETNLVSRTTSMVFDDPVSSVDHLRRVLIAQRLAKEARKRQVIVFTHDLSFAWELVESAQAHGIPFQGRRVYPARESKGLIADGLPHESGKIAARRNSLVELATRARKLLEEEKKPEESERLLREGYRKLRDLWERLVEECLFGDVVRRFGNSINTRELRKVEVEDQDYAAVDQGMSKCSNYTHDGPTEAPPPLPQPDEFERDLDDFKTTYERIMARIKVTEKRRAQT